MRRLNLAKKRNKRQWRKASLDSNENILVNCIYSFT